MKPLEADTQQIIAQLLAHLSHELRSPLNTFLAMVGLLTDAPLSPEQEDYLETAQQNGHLIQRLLNNLLELSKIDRHQLTIQQQSFNLWRWLEEVFDLAAEAAIAQKIELIYEIDLNVPDAMIGDATQLTFLLSNLLHEALKSNQQGEVLVKITGLFEIDGQFLLHFKVTGTQFNLPLTNTPLFWAAPQVSLNLITAKRVSDFLGGHMWVEAHDDEPAILHFTLPVEIPPETTTPSLRQLHPILQDKQILLVIPNHTLRHILSRLIQTWGVIPQAVTTTHEALEWLAKGEPCYGVIWDKENLITPPEFPTLFSTLPSIILIHHLKQISPLTSTELYLTKPVKYTQLHAALLSLFTEQSPMKFTQTKPTQGANLAQQHPLYILLAENNSASQKVIKRLLKKMGYAIYLATSGTELLEMLKQQTFDALLLSLELADMDTIGITTHIRSSLPPAKQPRIIALVGEPQQERGYYLSQSIDEIIDKPVRMNKLVAALTSCQPNPLILAETQLATSTHAATLPVIDLSQLKLLIGDYEQEMIAEFADMFMVEAPKQLSKMQQALAENDLKTLQMVVHTLKSTSATFGARRLAYLCKDLELQLIKGTVIQLETKVAEIETAYQAVEVALTEVMQQDETLS